MLGSLEAYDRFAAMLAGGGAMDGVRILKEETVKQMAVSNIGGADSPIATAFESCVMENLV